MHTLTYPTVTLTRLNLQSMNCFYGNYFYDCSIVTLHPHVVANGTIYERESENIYFNYLFRN